jgi:hypothetical protein
MKYFGGLTKLERRCQSAARGADRAGEYRPLLSWGQHYLPRHFVKPASAMHVWLAEELQDFHERRGSKMNLVGPRGSAKSTVVTLCYVLQAAVEGWEPYVWIVSDTLWQAQTHLENVKVELTKNRRLPHDYPFADFGLGDASREGGGFCSAEELGGCILRAAQSFAKLAIACPGLS